MFTINGRKIGNEYDPYIIAELSANHGGSIERAKASIKAAKFAGASAVKMQTYTPETMTIESNKDDFLIKSGLWEGYNLFNLYKEAFTPFEWHKELFNYARQIGITIFSSPFDETAVDLLSSLDTPAYKIASFELTDLPLIKYVAKKNKPMLISTGMASIDEIAETLEVCKTNGNNELLLFHCISSYPAPVKDTNLLNIKALKKEFEVLVGLSDHTTTNLASTIAVSLGAVAIEKHFKLDQKDCGPDESFSITPDKLKDLVNECNLTKLAMGSTVFTRSSKEADNMKFRRSIYFINNLKKGHIISKNDIRRIRPGFGLKPKYFNDIIGLELCFDVEKGDPVRFECFENNLIR
jgi:pseudaminic acid synthase